MKCDRREWFSPALSPKSLPAGMVILAIPETTIVRVNKGDEKSKKGNRCDRSAGHCQTLEPLLLPPTQLISGHCKSRGQPRNNWSCLADASWPLGNGFKRRAMQGEPLTHRAVRRPSCYASTFPTDGPVMFNRPPGSPTALLRAGPPAFTTLRAPLGRCSACHRGDGINTAELPHATCRQTPCKPLALRSARMASPAFGRSYESKVTLPYFSSCLHRTCGKMQI